MQQPMQYPIALFKDNATFHVTIPDLPDVTAQGKDMAEAIYNTRLAVSHYLYDLVQKNLPIPQPTPIGNYVSNPEFAGYIWAVASIELSRLQGEDAELTLRLPVQIVSALTQKYPDTDINELILTILRQHIETLDSN